jgi:hypothetical protein
MCAGESIVSSLGALLAGRVAESTANANTLVRHFRFS